MDFTIAASIQSLQNNGLNTYNNVVSKCGIDVIQQGINEGYLINTNDFIYLTSKGINLTRPIENNNTCEGDLICS